MITRKLGKLIRGNTTPFQLYAATLLGAFLGFTPGFDHAPGLILFWVFCLLILNANIFYAGVVILLSKLIYLVTLPIAFSIGRVLLEGPTQGLFTTLHNAPITAYFGLDYYVVPGGQVLGLVFGLACGFAASKGLKSYRKRMAQRQASGKPLLEGGTIDLTISGDLNAVDSDLVARAKFKDVNLLISGTQASLNGMDMPLAIRGPIDSPRIKVEADFLKIALKKAGKQKLLEEGSKKLGVDLGDETSSDGLKKAAGDLLGGFLNKKK